MMTNEQLTAILGVLTLLSGALGTLVRSCWTGWLESKKADREARVEDRRVIVENSAAMAGLRELAIHVLNSNRESIASNNAVIAEIHTVIAEIRAMRGEVGKVSDFVDKEISGVYEQTAFGDEPTQQAKPRSYPRGQTPRGVGIYRARPPRKDDEP